MLKSFNIYQC